MDRKRLTREYQGFKEETAEALKPMKPQITMFGSMKTKEKSPSDVDVQIDVHHLTSSQFRKARSIISRIRRKYPDVDPVFYSWPGKKMPPLSKRRKMRWTGTWEEHKAIAPEKGHQFKRKKR